VVFFVFVQVVSWAKTSRTMLSGQGMETQMSGLSARNVRVLVSVMGKGIVFVGGVDMPARNYTTAGRGCRVADLPLGGRMRREEPGWGSGAVAGVSQCAAR